MPIRFPKFWKKRDAKTKIPTFKIPVSEIPLFSSLGPAELRLVEDRMRRVEYKKGDIVYRIGGAADAFYIIVSGRFRVLGPKNECLSTLAQGDYFGESSILLGRDHSATIEAKNDSIVLRIDKNDFQHLLQEIPALSLHLSRTLGHRLTASATRGEVIETKVISICDHRMNREKSIFAWNLAAMLSNVGKKKTILVGLESEAGNRFEEREAKILNVAAIRSSHADTIQQYVHQEDGAFYFLRIGDELEGDDAEQHIGILLSFLIERYDFVLLDLPEGLGRVGVKCVQQSDLIYFLIGEKNRRSSKAQSLIKEFESSFGFTETEVRILLCEQPESALGVLRRSGVKTPSDFDVFAFVPYDADLHSDNSNSKLPYVLKNAQSSYSRTIRFLARELTGKLVGLALGSGAAYGFAHIGVLRVFEEENLPVDIIAGSSMGALVGGLWGSGLSTHDLERIALGLDQKSTFFKLIGVQDLLLPHHGFFRGVQVSRFLRQYIGKKKFGDLRTVVKVVAANLFTGEEVIFDEGDVVDAIRASISIPGIFKPVLWHDQYLIDGGVVDPLPVKVLSRYGVKKIIAVNVLSSPDDHMQRKEYYENRKAQEELALARSGVTTRLMFGIRERLGKRYKTNVFNVLMNTIQFLEYGIAESAAGDADIVIHPVVPDAHWAEFYSVKKFIAHGAEKTREQLADIKRLVEEQV